MFLALWMVSVSVLNGTDFAIYSAGNFTSITEKLVSDVACRDVWLTDIGEHVGVKLSETRPKWMRTIWLAFHPDKHVGHEKEFTRMFQLVMNMRKLYDTREET